jgi:hypothetical protein
MEKSTAPRRSFSILLLKILLLVSIIGAIQKYFDVKETWYNFVFYFILLPLAFSYIDNLLWKRKLRRLEQAQNQMADHQPLKPDRQ